MLMDYPKVIIINCRSFKFECLRFIFEIVHFLEF